MMPIDPRYAISEPSPNGLLLHVGLMMDETIRSISVSILLALNEIIISSSRSQIVKWSRRVPMDPKITVSCVTKNILMLPFLDLYMLPN